VKASVIKVERSCVWWAFDAAAFPASASYAIRHFTNIVELIYNSQPYFQSRDCFIYRMSQEECARLREGVPYVKVYRYNPKHLYPKLNGYGNNGQRSLKL